MGEPTPAARLAQARAFVDLCMLDRAWIRLKELRDTDGDDVDVLALTARMFLLRGWPNRARKPLEKALALEPDDERLQELWDAAAEPPDEPDSSLEESDDLEVLLPLAERYLCTGAMLKGRALLERLRRQHPDEQRVADLLWVLEGDFSLGDRSLAELTEEFGPDLSMLADLADESEHTESITKDEAAASREAADSAAFPSLFRNGGTADLTATDAESEITRATSLADLEALRESVHSARKSAGIVSGEEDTQIRRIIRRDSALDVGDADTVHVPATVPDDLDFDLEAYRSEMGMGDRPALPESDFDDPLEEEDDDLIIITRRERDDDEAPLLEPDPTSETLDHPDARRFLAEAERYKELDDDEPEAPAPPADRESRPRRRRRRHPAASATPVWLLVLAIILGIAAFFLAILVTYQFLAG